MNKYQTIKNLDFLDAYRRLVKDNYDYNVVIRRESWPKNQYVMLTDCDTPELHFIDDYYVNYNNEDCNQFMSFSNTTQRPYSPEYNGDFSAKDWMICDADEIVDTYNADSSTDFYAACNACNEQDHLEEQRKAPLEAPQPKPDADDPHSPTCHECPECNTDAEEEDDILTDADIQYLKMLFGPWFG